MDTRDEIVDFMRTYSKRTQLPTEKLISWEGIARSKFYDWIKRYGKVNEHNAWIPRDFWLTDHRKKAMASNSH